MSELPFAAMLVNTEIRSEVLPLMDRVDWKSPLAGMVAKFMIETHSEVARQDPIILKSHLVAHHCVTEEIDCVVENCKSFLNLSKLQVKFLLNDLTTFIKVKGWTQLLAESDNDVNKLLDESNSFRIELAKMTTTPKLTTARSLGTLATQPSDYIHSKFNLIEKSYSSGFGVRTGQLAMICAPPGTLKTTFLVYEAFHYLSQGRVGLWFTVGDLDVRDLMVKFQCLFFNNPRGGLAEIDADKNMTDEFLTCMDNFHFLVAGAGEISAQAIEDKINSYPIKADFVIVDYDANLMGTGLEMYGEGENTYNTLARIARPDHGGNKLVWVASQPKPQYWAAEKLPLEAAAESSRKQGICDLIVTAGRCHKITARSAGMLTIVKNRRGSVGGESPYMVVAHGAVRELEIQEYTSLKNISKVESQNVPESASLAHAKATSLDELSAGRSKPESQREDAGNTA